MNTDIRFQAKGHPHGYFVLKSYQKRTLCGCAASMGGVEIEHRGGVNFENTGVDFEHRWCQL